MRHSNVSKLIVLAALALLLGATTQIRLTTQVTGILPIANGGTGASSLPTIGGTRSAWCRSTVGTGNGTAYFLFPASTADLCTTTTGVEMPMGVACTARNLYVKSSVNGAVSGSGVMTLLKNGSSSGITCTLGTGQTCNDTTHTASFVATDTWSVTITTGQASDTTQNPRAAFLCN